MPKKEIVMLRKQILIPPTMDEKVKAVAKKKNISFGRFVRDAISFALDNEEDAKELINSMSGLTMSTEKTIKRINDLIDFHQTN